ncbi:MAG: SPFH domain-containing protein [Planctomycetota bacterium]|nr:SPFH domain-containing protein [Planctomycetota bacterium]
MNRALAVGVGLLLVVLLLLFSTTYTVRFNEVAIKATFGQTDESSVVREPGLHFQWPIFIDKVTKLDTRLQLVESPHEEITTADGLQIVVRAYLLWRIREQGEKEFFENYGSIDEATARLPGQFRTAFSGALSQYEFDDLVGRESRLPAAEEAIRAAMTDALLTEGVEPVSVGISQVMLPAKTTRAVLQRMQATRNVRAEAERYKGNAEAERIQSEAKTMADKIRAFATQRAEEIRALGEVQAAKYLEQMSQDEESEDLAIFLVWLNALQRALGRNTTVVLPAEIEPFHLLTPGEASARGPIPQPERSVAARDDGSSGGAEEQIPEEGGR